jgi:uncharacterized protein (DUF427 family)
VWDYPRPPRVEPSTRRIRVICNGETVAETTRAFRLLETSHPPVYYIPPEDVRLDWMTQARQTSVCEFKGTASYWALTVNRQQSVNAAWSYANPSPGYEAIKDYLAFYPGRVDAGYVDDERVTPRSIPVWMSRLSRVTASRPIT